MLFFTLLIVPQTHQEPPDQSLKVQHSTQIFATQHLLVSQVKKIKTQNEEKTKETATKYPMKYQVYK